MIIIKVRGFITYSKTVWLFVTTIGKTYQTNIVVVSKSNFGTIANSIAKSVLSWTLA